METPRKDQPSARSRTDPTNSPKLSRPPQLNLPSSSSSNTKKRKSPRAPHPSTSTPSSMASIGKGKEHGSQRQCEEHSFLTDVADVRQMEQGLLKLLDDFHAGHLQAFSEDCAFQKMDQVREQQEHLARLHFDLDGQQELHGLKSSEAREVSNKNLGRLMENLQTLCTSIQNLQQDQPAETDKKSEKKSDKKSEKRGGGARSS